MSILSYAVHSCYESAIGAMTSCLPEVLQPCCIVCNFTYSGKDVIFHGAESTNGIWPSKVLLLQFSTVHF